MTIDDLVEELLDIKKVIGNADVVQVYTVCGTDCQRSAGTPVITVDNRGNKLVELI